MSWQYGNSESELSNVSFDPFALSALTLLCALICGENKCAYGEFTLTPLRHPEDGRVPYIQDHNPNEYSPIDLK